MTILKDLREKAGLSQAQLSEKSGVKQPTICMLETGERKYPRLDIAVRLAKVLGCRAEDLYSPDEAIHTSASNV